MIAKPHREKNTHKAPKNGAEREASMSKTTGKAQAGTQAQGKADSKRKGKAEATAEAQASPQATADSKPTADSKKAEAGKADKPAGRAEAEAAALALVGEVKSHTGGRINLESVRVCPRKGGKVKAFLRPTYICPQGVTLEPYTAGGFTGFITCDLTTEAGRQTLAALIAAKRKPTAAETKKAEAEAKKAQAAAGKGKAAGATGKADSKAQAAGKPQGKAEAQATAGKATGQAGKGKATGKPQAGKATQGKGKAGKATA